MKTAISIPDDVFESADRLAKTLGVSRSELYARAVEKYIAAHRKAKVTERLNAVYASEPSSMSRAVLDAQSASIPDEEW